MEGSTESLEAQIKEIDSDYLNLYEINIVAGSLLSERDSTDGIMVNEKLAKLTGYKSSQDIVGKQLTLWDHPRTVVGVVKDFNTTNLSKPIEPVLLMHNVGGFRNLSIKLNRANLHGPLTDIQKAWESAYPEYIYSYSFLDDQVDAMYRGERRTSFMMGLFAAIAIFIGCLGLFGLVTFMANQKVKEVGVRKVLGASVESIVILFSKEFVKLILIGFLFAAPVAGFAMSKILEQFAYKIELGPGIFLLSIGVTFLIAFLTVGSRSIKAAMVNPVESLRAE